MRLHEARRRMLAEGLEATAAGHHVGYQSPPQFSRDYRRLFGAPPRTEINRMRAEPRTGTETATRTGRDPNGLIPKRGQA